MSDTHHTRQTKIAKPPFFYFSLKNGSAHARKFSQIQGNRVILKVFKFKCPKVNFFMKYYIIEFIKLL
jgi:hypothetical protein